MALTDAGRQLLTDAGPLLASAHAIRRRVTAAARGSAANPLKDAEIEDKLRAEADAWQKGHNIQPLIDAVWTLDKSDDVSARAKLVAPE